ncbi:MAG: helix-turn-helix transcriptional regulator [Bacilli bacterium]|nr:helix-turn-helix transcriptional regulator [Bacilli bacterium]MDD4547611.1 helix-turn-helix transcriptional regulator [Bacilli bacterium]
MIIGERIRKARQNKGLSQEEFGKLIGVSKVSVSGYEAGIRIPSLKTLIQIVDFLEVNFDYVLGREITTVSDSDIEYQVKLAKDDINIIKELRKHPVLYNKIISAPQRTIELISRRMTN